MRTGERSYLYALNEIFPPLAEEFKPDIIIANGGSDAHFADHLGSLGLTARGFFEISRIISSVSEKVCSGKVILLVGSGYNINVLPYCWYALALGLIKPDASLEKIAMAELGESQKNSMQPKGYPKQVLELLLTLILRAQGSS